MNAERLAICAAAVVGLLLLLIAIICGMDRRLDSLNEEVYNLNLKIRLLEAPRVPMGAPGTK
jgi:hypothetical protein